MEFQKIRLLFSKFKKQFLMVVHPRKLNLREIYIILLSRIAILLLIGSFERKETIFQEKYLIHKQIMHLTNFIFTRTFFLIASYQILHNYAILINHDSFLQEKESSQLYCFFFFSKNIRHLIIFAKIKNRIICTIAINI